MSDENTEKPKYLRQSLSGTSRYEQDTPLNDYKINTSMRVSLNAKVIHR